MTTASARPQRLLENAELLRERLRAAPEQPGVYLMRDVTARVMYVGKAANLRNRLRSWFTGIEALQPRTRRLVERAFDVEVILAASEREALILENTLIKRYRPRFNVRLKDDKNYLYLKIPAPGAADIHAPGTAREAERKPRAGTRALRAADFPRPYYTRAIRRDGARYFGPYTSAQSLRTTVKSLRTIFPFRTCSDEIFRRGHVCLDFHIKRCSGPCEGRIEGPAYAHLLEQVELFMLGRSSVLTRELEVQMRAASERTDYEQAGRFRDRLRAIEHISERQAMLRGGSRDDQDCVAVVIEAGRAMAATLFVREGRVTGMETHEIEGVEDHPEGEVLSGFVSQYYGSATRIPKVVLVSHEIADAQIIGEVLTEQRGSAVSIRVPQRGALRELVEQARQTATTALRQARIVEDFDAERTDALLGDLQERLALPARPQRIECYDISNTMGTNSVGSMVVFENGRPNPAHYRHFGIKTVEGSDDFASMAETLRRRFARHLRAVAEDGAAADDVPLDDPAGSNGGGSAGETLEVAESVDESEAADTADDGGGHERQAHGAEGAEGPDGAEGAEGAEGAAMPQDGPAGVAALPSRPHRRRRSAGAEADSFAVLPDLILIDGGKGQLNAARAVLEAAGLEDVPVFGLAKQHEELFRPGEPDPIIIERESPTLFLVQRVRDEAHRFAITRHRARRGKAALRSRLDVVSGLGPTRRRALLRRFGSIDGIQEASLEELSTVVPRSVALRVKELL